VSCNGLTKYSYVLNCVFEYDIVSHTQFGDTMKIFIRGKNDKLSRKEIREIISFIGNILLGKKLSRHIKITLKNRNLKRFEWGYCGPTDYYNRNHRNFEILLNCQSSRKTQILTIIHELVHIKQFARNELRNVDNEIHLWLNRTFLLDNYRYDELPWEQEAAQTESVLYKVYQEHVKQCHKMSKHTR